MSFRILFLISLFLLPASITIAQESAIYRDANQSFKNGMYFYEEGLYGQAREEFGNVAELFREPHQGTPPIVLRDKAELYNGFSAIRLDALEGERLVLDFIQKHDPASIAHLARYEMGNYYYDNQNFEKAIEYYSAVDSKMLENDEINDLKFKESYAYFVRKKFKKARNGFKEIKDIQNEYYYPSNYYYGVCAFFENDYDAALSSFQKVNASNKYSKIVPYYICQIYFARKQYEELVTYGEPLTKDEYLKYNREINQLVGQSYFEMGNFAKALPFLETYVSQTGQLTEKEVYQLAYTQYKTGNYENAIENFEQLRDVDSELGQNALYNLAGSYLQTGRKNTARSAFLLASNMDYNPKIKVESKFNYAKLSYELGYDREAINTLLEFKPGSENYAEAQELMGSIFLNTRDYARSLEIIEGLTNRNEKIEAAYQKVAYNRAIQLYHSDDKTQVENLLNKAAARSYDMQIKGLAYYWLGEIAYYSKQYDKSLEHYGKYQTIAKTLPRMPDEASLATSNYAIAYNYWKKENYSTARNYFKDAVTGIKTNIAYIKDPYVTSQLLADATIRAADCYFKANQYPQALEHYNEAISKAYEGFDYAMYQKAIILGLQNKSVDKIIVLESIFTNYPKSFYADDAMFEVGNTYLRIGKLENAAEAFTDLLQKQKDSEYVNPSLLKLGLIYVNLGQNQKGLEYFKRVFANNPDPQIAKDALNGIEEIYIAMDDTDGYFKFLDSVPGYSISNLERDSIKFKAAETHYGNGDYIRAARAYSDYLQDFPRGRSALNAHFKRAESYFAVKDYRKAVEDYEFLLQKLPNPYAATSAKKAALVQYNILEDFAKAYVYYKKYADLAGSDDDLYEAQLGALRSAYRSGNGPAVLELAGKVAGNSKATKEEKAAAQYYLGKVALAESKYDQALTAFNQVIALTNDERSAEARYRIAYIYYMQRDLEVAKDLCLSANSQIQGYEYWLAKNVLLLADIFTELGDFFNARASLESIIENYTGDKAIIDEAKLKLEKLNQRNQSNLKFAPKPDPNADLKLDAPIDGNQ